MSWNFGAHFSYCFPNEVLDVWSCLIHNDFGNAEMSVGENPVICNAIHIVAFFACVSPLQVTNCLHTLRIQHRRGLRVAEGSDSYGFKISACTPTICSIAQAGAREDGGFPCVTII